MSVLDAVRGDIESIRKTAPELADSGLAALALSMAAEVDITSGTAKSNCGRIAFDVIARLYELAPPVKKADAIDEINERREKRRAAARGAAAAD